MSIDFELMKLIAKGKKPDARYDIVRLIEADKCVTIAILDAEITDLQDKAIRNFVEKLEIIHFVEISIHKPPGDRWIQLIQRKGAEFQLHEVIQKHKATRKKRAIHKDICDTIMIEDIPFQINICNQKEIELRNRQLDLSMRFYETSIEDAAKQMRCHLQSNRLEQYLEIKKKRNRWLNYKKEN